MGQDGSLYAVGETCYLKYYIIEDGKLVHTTTRDPRISSVITDCSKN